MGELVLFEAGIALAWNLLVENGFKRSRFRRLKGDITDYALYGGELASLLCDTHGWRYLALM